MSTTSNLLFSIFIFFTYYMVICFGQESGMCGSSTEVYIKNGSNCQTECAFLDKPCNVVCFIEMSGCYCKEGYARHPDTGDCIPIGKCPKQKRCCGQHEEYQDCIWECPRDCSTLDIQCKLACCQRGCFCKEGFTRHHETGKCIHTERCQE